MSQFFPLSPNPYRNMLSGMDLGVSADYSGVADRWGVEEGLGTGTLAHLRSGAGCRFNIKAPHGHRGEGLAGSVPVKVGSAAPNNLSDASPTSPARLPPPPPRGFVFPPTTPRRPFGRTPLRSLLISLPFLFLPLLMRTSHCHSLYFLPALAIPIHLPAFMTTSTRDCDT